MHLGTVPLTLAAGIVLIVLSPDHDEGRVPVFTASALLLFGVSAIYHTGTWSPRLWAFWRRWDHANIFLLIAGFYTAFSLLLLHFTSARCCSRRCGPGDPRRRLPDLLDRRPLALRADLRRARLGGDLLHPGFADGAIRLGVGIGIATFVMILVGGGSTPSAAWSTASNDPTRGRAGSNFHEVFHTFTILAFTAHFVGVSMATFALR